MMRLGELARYEAGCGILGIQDTAEMVLGEYDCGESEEARTKVDLIEKRSRSRSLPEELGDIQWKLLPQWKGHISVSGRLFRARGR
jgi:hypothetical protein